jgi:hypothetical protein
MALHTKKLVVAHMTQSIGLIQVRQKHLTVFEISKPACPLCGASVLTVIVHSAVWSLVRMECWLIFVYKFHHFALKRYFI